MKDKVKNELNSLINGYEKRKAKQVKKFEAQKREEDKFLQEFYLIRKKIIKPAMIEIGELLKSRGRNYQIDEQDEEFDREVKTKDARINVYFLILEKGYESQLFEYPFVSFIADKRKKKIVTRENTTRPNRGGHSGDTGSYSLSQITTDLVHQKIMNVLKELF